MTILLLGNIRKWCKQYISFCCKRYVMKQPFRILLITAIYFWCNWRIPIRNSTKTAGCRRLYLWRFGGSGVIFGWFSVFCFVHFLLCERLFLESWLYWIPQCFKHSFQFNLTYSKVFYRELFQDEFLIRFSYYISHLWNSTLEI